MEKSEENTYNSSPNEGRDRQPGSLDLDLDLRSLLADIIKQCPKKREEIAAEMSYLVDRSITVAMLNSFTAESREGHRFPAAWIPAFCTVTGDLQLLHIFARLLRLHIVDEHQFQLIEFAEAMLAKERAERDLEKVRKQLLEGR